MPGLVKLHVWETVAQLAPRVQTFSKCGDREASYDTDRYTMSDHCYAPMQIAVAVKQHNAQKRDSHAWYVAIKTHLQPIARCSSNLVALRIRFIKAFCERVEPEFVVLIDAGTRVRC